MGPLNHSKDILNNIRFDAMKKCLNHMIPIQLPFPPPLFLNFNGVDYYFSPVISLSLSS